MALGEVYQGFYLQEGKLSIESLRHNFNLTDNLKKSKPASGAFRMPVFRVSFHGDRVMALDKMFHSKGLVSSKQGFALQGQLRG